MGNYPKKIGTIVAIGAFVMWGALPIYWKGQHSWAMFGATPVVKYILLPGTGIVTALPLIAFVFGARRIRLATIGFLQYISPTGMLVLGVFIYHEPFMLYHIVTFCLIWTAIALYSMDGRIKKHRLCETANL